MKVTIEVGDEVQKAISAALASVVQDVADQIAEMKQDLEEMNGEMQKMRKGIKNAFDPMAYEAFFDEVSTASRLHLDRMRKYLHEMWELRRCQTSTLTEPTPPTSSDQKEDPR